MLLPRYKPFVRITALAIIIASKLVVAGWLADSMVLKSIFTGLPVIKFNIAICFMLASLSLLLITIKTRLLSIIQEIATTIVFIIALLTIIETYIITGINIDEVIIKDNVGRLAGNLHPGRMDMYTSVCMLLSSIALIFISSNKKRLWSAAQYCLHTITLISFVSLLEQLYVKPDANTLPLFSTITITAAVFFFFFSIAASFINSSLGFTGLLTSKKAGSTLARRFFFLMLFIAFVPWLMKHVFHLQIIDSINFGVTFFIIPFITACFLLIAYVAKYLNQKDDKIDKTEEILQSLNLNLEEMTDDKFYDLKAIFTGAPDAIVVIDEKGKVYYWNPHATKIFGWAEDEIRGHSLSETIVPPQFREAHIAGMNRFLQTGKSKIMGTNIEITAMRKNGTEIEVALTISPIEVKDRLMFIGFLRDITEQKKKDEIILNNERKFKLALGIMGDNVWEYDFLSNKTVYSETIIDFTGYTNEEIADHPNTWKTLVHPDDIWMLENSDKKYKAGLAGSHQLEYRIFNKQGLINWVLDRGVIIERDSNNSPLKMVGTYKDITSRKTAEASLAKLKKQFQSFMEHIPAMAWIIDKQSVYHFTNENYSKTFHTDSDNNSTQTLIGKKFYDFFPEEIAAEYKRNNDIVFDSNNVLETIEPSVDKNGKEIILKVFKFPLHISNTETLLGGIAIDITELVKAEEDLRILNEKITTSNKELEQFAYVASHDLQEPLRMVSSFLQLLEKKYHTQLDDTAKQYIHFAVDGADRMKTLILDLLAFSRIGTQIQFDDAVDINDIIDKVRLNLMTVISESDAKIEVAGKLPVIRANEIQILQLFQNLISNALKYRSNKTPQIEIGCKAENVYYKFYVKDNGIGIDEKYFEKIFVIFQRLHTRSEFAGTGIGLSICKKIVEKHNGYITVESAYGQGSTFNFYIPK